ncbi:MAG: GspH/FimT family pseudopilin [Polaromonas sp.]
MRSFSRGFTLIELMVVVALAAILLGIGVPSFKSFVAGQRVKTAAGDFAMALVFARAEAIKRNADVTITAATSGATGWQDGWTVAAGGGALSTQSAYPGLMLSGPTSAITFKSTGRLSNSVTTMTITGQDGSARCVAIDLSGLPKSTKSTTGACS